MSMLKWHWPTPNGLPPLPVSASIVATIALLFLSASTVEVSFQRVIDGWQPLLDFFASMMIAPDWSYLGQLGEKMLETVEMTALGTAIALVISLPVGILAAENTSPHPLVFRAMRELL
ncbi:MAG TPA: hypothetical protein VKA23_00025, partial [Mariprofundaceae bacterium]|nr:hypothetical protein [Mariprofundaceae bacterium]